MKIEATPLVRPPKIPSKTEIIPIHASDRGTFKRCRRLWEWSSPMNMNLISNVEQMGVDKNLWFGTGVHHCLAQYYNPILQRDPVETFKAWWDIQWNGGTVTAEQAELSYDRHAREVITQVGNWALDVETTYKVKGLQDMLPDPDLELYEELRELGIGMLTFYKEYADREDNFTVICEEHTFSIPILAPDGSIMERIDPRDGRFKEVHLRGTQDAIIQDNENGQFGILEHKTAIQVGEEYHRKLERDEQCTTYMYAAEREATLYGLEYDSISFVLYNALRKAYPKPPTPLSNGLFSINRQSESTTYPMLMDYIRSNSLDIVMEGIDDLDNYEGDDKHTNYVKWVKESGDEQFIVRSPVRRNKHEIQSIERRVYQEASDMLNEDTELYPNISNEWSCLNCRFREPCMAREDGSDWKMILEDQYEPNWTR